MDNQMIYRQLKKEMLAFLNEWFEGDLGDTTIRTGKDGAKYSEYCGKNTVMWISIDGSPMYECMNYGEDGWRFQTAFWKFLEDRGFWYEMGHAWNINIYRQD
jgi:hypothetical protein